MTSIFMRNPRLVRNEPITDEVQATIESQEEEILSLRKQLSSLKTLYKEFKVKDGKEDSTSAYLSNSGDAAKKEISRKDSAKEVTGELLYQRQRIEKLLTVVAEREKQLRELRHEIQTLNASQREALNSEKNEKQTALAEVKALHSQLSALKNRFIEVQGIQKSQAQEVEILTAENYKAKVKIQEALKVAEERDYLKKECDRISNIQTDLMLCQEEKTSRIVALESSLNIKEQQLLEKDQKISTLVLNLEDIEKKMGILQNEKNLLQDGIFRTQSDKEDAEARLKMAHFHLAKKVKEATLQADLNEALKVEVRELSTDLNDSLLKIQELQKHLEEQFHVEKRLQDQFQDSLKESAALANAWEEKYFNISDKWEEFEFKFNDMKKLEDKFQKIHSQWINMGFLFDGLEQTAPKSYSSLTESGQTFIENETDFKKNTPSLENQLGSKQTYQNFEQTQNPKLFMSNIIQNPSMIHPSRSSHSK